MAAVSSTNRERQCCKPFSRGVLILLVMSGLANAAQWFVFQAIDFSLPHGLRLGFDSLHYALWVLLPLTGWMAESWLGRYRSIVVGLVTSSVVVFLVQVAFIILEYTLLPALVLIVAALVLGTLSIGSFYSIMLPFTLDQIIGASAEELSAVVQWYCWGIFVGRLFEDVCECIYHLFPYQLLQLDIVPVTLLTVGSVSLFVILAMDCLCHKWLDTRDKTGNPIKLIIQVLNYARKNKYPRLRSAFTYIDEEQPSRLDLGKHKFGGPFTEEEVEDVKTVFRLVPLLVAALGTPSFCCELYDQLGLHAIVTANHTFSCVANMKHSIFLVASFVLIPFYRLVVNPLFGKYFPSMLKMIGVGLFLCMASTVVSLAIGSVGHFYSNSSHCVFDDHHDMARSLPLPLYLVVIVESVNGVGGVVLTCSLYEFVVAQTPNRMRGIVIGFLIAMIGIGALVSSFLVKLFRQFPTATPSCVFYYYLVLSLLMLLILVVYVILAKRYKLRERDRHINIHAIVEEHYERYFDQEEEYMREASRRN